MNNESGQSFRLIKLTGGSITPIGLFALGDYGNLFISWNLISHLEVVLFEKVQKGLTSNYLIILLRDRFDAFYFDGSSVKFKELLQNECTDNVENNLRIFIKKIILQLFDTCVDPSLFSFLKGTGYTLKKFSNLKNLGDFCEKLQAAKSFKANEEGFSTFKAIYEISGDIPFNNVLDKCRNFRNTSLEVLNQGYLQLTGQKIAEIDLKGTSRFLCESLSQWNQFFKLANEIDPYYHMLYAGFAFQHSIEKNFDDAISNLKKAVNLIPYPLGLNDFCCKLYYLVLEKMIEQYEDSEEFITVLESLIGVSPRSIFVPLLISMYKSRGIKPDFYKEFVSGFYMISQKKYPESLGFFENAMNYYPDFIWNHHWQGVALSRMGRIEAAQRAFDRMIEKIPSAQTYLEIFLMKKNKDNKDSLEQALSVNPYFSWIYYLLGNHILYYQKDYLKAKYFFTKSVYLDPDSSYINKIQEEIKKQAAQNKDQKHTQYRKEMERGDVLAEKYEIVKIFRGGMGIVYIAHDSLDNRLFAIKTFQERFLWDKSVIRMFIKEAETWIKIEAHKNIVQARFIKLIDEKPYLFLEYVRGTDLQRILDERSGRLSIEEAIDYAIQFCNGMSFAYSTIGIVHRDIKPSNCLISEDNILKITDFGLVRIFRERAEEEFKGIAKQLPDDLRVTSTNSFMGTLGYMAPERLLYLEAGGIASDIYSFGVMLYQMLSGKLPYSLDSIAANPSILLDGIYTPVNEIIDEIPVKLSDIVRKCLETDNAKRYGDFNEVREDLLAFFEDFTKSRYSIDETFPVENQPDLIIRANSLSSIGKLEEALSYFDRVINMQPSNIEAITGRGVTLLKMGRNEEAIICFEIALRESPNKEEILYNKGNALLEMCFFDEAIQCFDRVIELEPANALSWWKKGVTFIRIGQYKQALGFIDNALKIDPKLSEAWDDRGLILINLGYMDEALHCFESALKINPASVKSLFSKARVLYNQMKYKESIDNFDLVLSIRLNDRDALMGKASSLEKMMKYTDAANVLKKILELYPDDKEAYKNLVLAVRNEDMYEEALGIIESIRSLGLIDGEILKNEADLLKELFCFKESICIFEKILETEKNNESVAFQIEQITKESKTCDEFLKDFYDIRKSGFDELRNGIEKLIANGSLKEAMSLINKAISYGTSENNQVFRLEKARLLNKMGRKNEALYELDRLLLLKPEESEIVAERESIVKSYGRKEQKGIINKLFSSGKEDSYELFITGIKYLDAGKHSEAKRYFEDSLRDVAENAYAWCGLGQAIHNSGECEKALKYYNQALALDDSMAEIWCFKGESEEKLGMYRESQKSYEMSLSLNPFFFRSWINRLAYLEETGQRRKLKLYSAKALEIAEEKLKESPDDCDIWLKKSFFEYLLKRYHKSIKSCFEAISKQAVHSREFVTEGLANRELKKYNEAFKCFKKMVEAYPKDLLLLIHLAYTYEVLAEYDEADKIYSIVLDAFPTQEWVLYKRSVLFFKRDEPEDGLRCIDAILEHKPKSARAWKSKGDFLFSQGKDDEALWCFRSNLEANPDDFVSMFNLTVMLNKAGRASEAKARIDVLLENEPFNPDLWVLKGETNLLLGDISQALSSYDKAIMIDSRYVKAYIQKAVLLHQNKKSEEANRVMEDVINLYPANSSLWNNIACIQYEMGKRSEAEKSLERARFLDNQNEIIMFNKAIILFYEKTFSEAAKILDCALIIKPDFVDGLIVRGILYEMADSPGEAIVFYDQALKKDRRNSFILFCKGNALYSMNKLEEAVKIYSQSVKNESELKKTLLYKGIALQRLQRKTEAEQCFISYRKLTGSNAEPEIPEKIYSYMEVSESDVFKLKMMEHGFNMIHDEPKIIFRDIDFLLC